MSTDPVLHLSGVEFGWEAGSRLLAIEDFQITENDSVFLKGPSGSGKSTLLGLIGGVLTPQAGSIRVAGHDMATIASSRRDQVRADHLGIIFQQFNLLPYLSVLGNITLPCRFSAKRRRASIAAHGSPEKEAKALVSALGLPPETLTQPVAKLSVGQQQRVAVARALIGGPQLIIADEPTSALDEDNRDRFIELLNTQRAEFGSSLLFVSHDSALAKHFDRSVDLDAINTAASVETA